MRSLRRTRKKPSNAPFIPPPDRDILATLSLSALQHNLTTLQRSARTEIMPVLKANAYGHGMIPLAHHLRRMGVRYLGVATLGEAILLRHSGDTGRIFSWLYDPHGPEVDEALSLDLDLTLFDESHLPLLTKTIPRGTRVRLTVFVDTGIHRAGIPYERALQVCRQVAVSPCFLFVGLMSHLASSHRPNDASVHRALRDFRALRDTLQQEGICPPLVHIANTDACLQYDVSDCTLARAGSGIIGLSSAPSSLRPIMNVSTRILQIKRVKKGEGIGYGGTVRAPRTLHLALLPLGYADGIPASLTHGAFYRGRSVRRIIGPISMDQLAVEARPGDRVGDILHWFGPACPQSASQVARQAHCSTLELFSHLGYRMERRYEA